MKKYAFTIAAVLVFAGLLVFVLRDRKEPEAPPPPDQFFTVLEFVRDDLQQFEITEYFDTQALAGDAGDAAVRVNSRVALARNDHGGWTVLEPGPPRADQAAVDTFLYNISSLQVERKVEDASSDLEKYGLKQPHYEVKAVMKDGSQHIIQIGGLNELADGYYLKIVGKKPIYIIPRAYLDTVFDSGRLIDKALTDLDYEESFVSAELTLGDTHVQCVKQDDEWIRQQGSEAQDCNAIGTRLFEILLDAHFNEWMPDDKLPDTKEALELSPARILAVAVTDTDQTVEIALGRPVMDRMFAENVGRGEVYLVPAELEEDILSLLVIEQE